MGFFSRSSVIGTVLILTGMVGSARGVQPPGIDVLEERMISSFPRQATPTDPRFPARGLHDGGSRVPSPRPTLFLDANGPAGTVDYAQVVPSYASPQRICGVTLYVLSDGGVEDGLRGVSDFSLRAMFNPFGPPGPVLVEGVNPRDDGSPNTYLFPEMEVWGVYAYFTRSTDSGPRVVELDGIGVIVPEPGAAVLLAAAAGALLLTRRRRPR